MKNSNLKTSIIIIVYLVLFASCNNTSFDSAKWKRWDGKKSYVRWDMAYDLIKHHNLKGKNHKEIEDLLGKPDIDVFSSTDKYEYDLGPCRKNFDFGILTIEFKNDTVIKVEKHCN